MLVMLPEYSGDELRYLLGLTSEYKARWRRKLCNWRCSRCEFDVRRCIQGSLEEMLPGREGRTASPVEAALPLCLASGTTRKRRMLRRLHAEAEAAAAAKASLPYGGDMMAAMRAVSCYSADPGGQAQSLRRAVRQPCSKGAPL